MNVLVFANPENKAARLLCADALEQLGYLAELETWRNAYLSAALELRSGNAAQMRKNNCQQQKLFDEFVKAKGDYYENSDCRR